MISESTLPEKPCIHLDENIHLLNELLGADISWDIIHKEFHFGGIRMYSYCINGFFYTQSLVNILKDVSRIMEEYVSEHDKIEIQKLQSYLNTHISFVQVSTASNMRDILYFILSGPIVFLFDGLQEALIIDTRVYPSRNPSEPEVERVVRGPRDGFTETMLTNTALIRRRLRDPKLRIELFRVGKRSKTDVSLLYIADITNPQLIDEIRKQIKAIDIDGIPMADGALIDYLTDQKTKWNIYPSVRLTERPDVAATALLEGQIVVIIDTTPEALILPCVFLQHVQHPDDYHLSPFAGTYFRLALLGSLIISIFLSPLWLALVGLGTALPQWLMFINPDNESQIPLTLQLLILEFGVDIFRRAVVNTPVPMASAIGFVSAVIFSQLAVKAKLFDTDVLVYTTMCAMTQYATASLELSNANRVARVFLILITGIFSVFHLGWLGFLIGIIILFIGLLRKRAFGIPYLWPLIPFNWEAFQDILFRQPFKNKAHRPSIFRPIDPTRK
ncbi:spore germination protein [Collibacillus ludicampi]|uniref:Spore germination protein n=1 Tax=Collibacillus ludicampi TaxID=2771369 RepID=A0AAV4LC87_9BACL|nr:spore germination protein [Collibacillus ludicampi]GIM45274.1 spore germination protein [Collibacillus ludicampi]